MNRTILIGMNNKFSATANKWLFSLTGLLFLVNGGFHVYNNTLEPFGLAFGILMIAGALYYLFYGLFGFSENSKFASKVKITNSIIELKNSLWKPATQLKWSELSSIKFQSYEIIFELKDSTSSFSYNSNGDTSRTIKETIREFAEQKNIEITGG